MVIAAVLYWIMALALAAGCLASSLALPWSPLVWGIGKAAGVLLLAVIGSLAGAWRGIPKRNAAQ